MSDSHIDTKEFGLLLEVWFPGKGVRPHLDLIQFKFDTGVIMYVPEAFANAMKFSLQEKDP